MYQKLKRTFDVFVTVVMIVLIAPVGAAVAIMLWVAHRRVLFAQMRPGIHGKPFILYKFNTMTEERNEYGVLLPDVARLTRVGSLTRRLSLDELPQLWNVLRGDMSLVGPRPLLMKYVERYSPEQARRHEVIPGITGWAQVNGRNAISWEERFRYDVWYVDNASFLLDIRILLMTMTRVICGAGVSSHGHATMPEFEGATQCLKDVSVSSDPGERISL